MATNCGVLSILFVPIPSANDCEMVGALPATVYTFPVISNVSKNMALPKTIGHQSMILPFAIIRRAALLVSHTYITPFVSSAIPAGLLNLADVAAPSTNPLDEPVPANVDTNPAI
jgi:hypothetical protein